MPNSVTLSGDGEFMRFLKQSPERSAQMMATAVYEEATEAFGQSQDLVPVRYGILRASGFVTAPKVINHTSETTIAYGGAAAPYAAYVHEITTHHHDAPTRAKFLSYPLEMRFPVLGKRIAARLENMYQQMLGR
jgi:hypothetical protein